MESACVENEPLRRPGLAETPDHDARNVGEIFVHRRLKLSARHEIHHLLSLRVTDFDQNMATRRQVIYGTCHNATNNVQTVCAAVESKPRLVIPHFGLKIFDFGAADVGRIGDDHVEANIGAQRREQIAADQV